MVFIRYPLTISQQERKKAIEKPSGAGALSEGMSFKASLISASVKGRPKFSRR
jgi:hypothetical protein